MAGTTASLLLAAVVAPITLLWGPIVSLNVVMILAPAVSAWAANRLCRHITGAAWPSLLAGATYGFSTYEIAQLVGHPQMVVMICPPLVALCVIRLLDGTLSTRRFVIELSGLLIVQTFLSVEVLFTMTLVGDARAGRALGDRHSLSSGASSPAGCWVLALPLRHRRRGVILVPARRYCALRRTRRRQAPVCTPPTGWRSSCRCHAHGSAARSSPASAGGSSADQPRPTRTSACRCC